MCWNRATRSSLSCSRPHCGWRLSSRRVEGKHRFLAFWVMAGYGMAARRQQRSPWWRTGMGMLCSSAVLASFMRLSAAWVLPRAVPQKVWVPPCRQVATPMAPSRQGVVTFSSSFDSLGMPKIRPRGASDDKPQEETPAVVDVTPARPVPEMITMSPFDLLIEQTDEIGLFLREVLLQHYEYTVRLPRPELFTQAFTNNYFQRSGEFPNFGASAGMSAEEWWAPIFYKTFLDLDMPKEDVDEVFVGVFEQLYYESLVGDWAWEPVDDVLPLLDKFLEWRLDGGPKLGLVTDYDERITTILENLGISHYFDVVVSSREAGATKPNSAIFALAAEKAGVKDVSKVMHLGVDFDKDVVGSALAGFQAIWIVCPSYDILDPQQEALQVKYEKIGDLNGILEVFGRSDPERFVTTTWKNKNRPEDLKVFF